MVITQNVKLAEEPAKRHALFVRGQAKLTIKSAVVVKGKAGLFVGIAEVLAMRDNWRLAKRGKVYEIASEEE